MPAVVIVDAEVGGRRVDVRVDGGRISAVGPGCSRAGAHLVAAGGAALLPGLHDHHLHLLAMAAARTSVDCASPGCEDPEGFDAALRRADDALPPGRWLRAIGAADHHGPLDRHRLDALAPGRPVRVQHRSGAAWVVSTAGLQALGLSAAQPGVELDPTGAPTGWLHRLDELVAERAGADGPPDLAPIGARLASLGVTGVTDATPYEDASALAVLARGCRSGALPQHVAVTGGPRLAAHEPPDPLVRGPVKVVVADNDLPSPDALVRAFLAARDAGRPVAVHCVTRVGVVLALAAWESVGAVDGDRIEHGAVLPVELVERIVDLRLRVVTQPGFVVDRGDAYLREVEPDDQPHLYRCRSLLGAGVLVAGSTDAPFGPDDPWLAMRAAIERRTAIGAVLGPTERIAGPRALDLFLGPLADPGGSPRQIVAGAPADLCLLTVSLEAALRAPSADLVRATWVAGRVVHGQA